MKLFLLLFIPIFIIGCGVNEDIHKEALSKLQAKKAELKKSLSETVEANKEIAGLQKTLEEKEQENKLLSSGLSEKEQRIKDLSAEMSAALDTKNAELDAKNAELDKALSETIEADKKIAGLQKTLQEKEQQNNEISASVSAKEQRIKDLSAETSAALDTKNAELDKAFSKTVEANKEISTLQKTVQEKEQEIYEISASVSAKEQRIEELTAEMFAALDTINAELGKALSETGEANEKIAGLQKTMQEKEQELVEVSVEMSAALDAKKAEMSATLDAKNAELDKAFSKTAAANKEIAALQKTVYEKEQKNKILYSGLEDKVQWIDQLGKKISAKDARINQLSATVSAKERRIEEVSADMAAALDKKSAEMSAALDVKNAELNKAFAETAGANKEIAALQKIMQKKEQLNEVLSSGLSEKVNWISDISAKKGQELVDFKNTYEKLVKTLKNEVERGEIKISRAMDSLLVKIVDKILFASGKTTIKKSGRKVLQKIGDVLDTVKNRQIIIKGHTDNVPIGKNLKEEFPTNWELSAMRAINVVHYLHEKVGISPETLSATGYSKFRPVTANDTPEGRAENRRIEIALLPLDMDKVLKELEK